MRILFSEQVSQYLKSETQYLRLRDMRAAETFKFDMREACRTLERFPDLGTRNEAFPALGFRTLTVGAYVLNYVRKGDVIEIVTIRHGRQSPVAIEQDAIDDFES